MFSIKPKIPIFILLILISVSLLTGIAMATDYPVSSETDFREAIAEVNNATPGGSHTILIHNDFNFTNYTQEEHENSINLANNWVMRIPLTYQGTLTIKSDVAGPYTVGETVDPIASPYNTYTRSSVSYVPALFLGLVGNDTTVIFEDIIFDGVGISMGCDESHLSRNLTVKNAHVINSSYSGIYIKYTNDSVLDNVTVSKSNNGNGGGISILNSYNITIKDSDIVNNKAIGAPTGSKYYAAHQVVPCGGGIYMNMSTVEICGDTNITGNFVDGYSGQPFGGGIYADLSALKIYGKTNISDNRVLANSGVYSTHGGGIFVNGTVPPEVLPGLETNLEIYDDVVISNNTAYFGGGIYANNESGLLLRGNASVLNNTAIYGGGGIAANSDSGFRLLDNSSVSENKARYGGGIYLNTTIVLQNNSSVSKNSAIDSGNGLGGGIYVDERLGSRGNLTLLDNSSISENKADYGGGIFLCAPLTLQNNSSVSKNSATYWGGGIYLNTNFNPMTSISGVSGETVSLVENTAMEGGAVYISGVEDMNKYGLFKKTTDDSALTFSNNKADQGYLWNLTDPVEVLTATMEFIVDLPPMENTAFSAPFSNAYNNYDINFIKEDIEVEIVPVTVQYYADDLDSTSLGATSFNSYIGAELTASNITSGLGGGWLNLHQPSGYMTGRLQETLPITISGDTILKVLYLPRETGGGPGTGSATVSNPTGEAEVLAPEPSVPPVSQTPAYTEELEVIVLFFALAIACYSFVMKRELEDDY